MRSQQPCDPPPQGAGGQCWHLTMRARPCWVVANSHQVCRHGQVGASITSDLSYRERLCSVSDYVVCKLM